MDKREEVPGPLWQRLAWFVGLWLLGVLAVSAVGYSIRLWLIG